MTRRPWTAAEDDVLRERYPHEPTFTTATALPGRTVGAIYQRALTIGLHKSDAYLSTPAAGRMRPGDNRGGSSRFAKGHVPVNKGVKRGRGWAPGRMAESQFKPGDRCGAANRNWKPIGTVALDADGYQRIKVREARAGERAGFGNPFVWPQLHRRIWEQANGPIPAGHAVVFRDGNKAHCALANLELVSQRELMRRNSIHARLPKDLVRTVQLLNAVKRQIRRRTQHGQPTHHR